MKLGYGWFWITLASLLGPVVQCNHASAQGGNPECSQNWEGTIQTPRPRTDQEPRSFSFTTPYRSTACHRRTPRLAWESFLARSRLEGRPLSRGPGLRTQSRSKTETNSSRR